MLTPQLIDCLNRHHCLQIQKLERQHKHIEQLNKLVETMNASVADIITDGAIFAIQITMPAYWEENIDELAKLLHDYGYSQPNRSSYTQQFYCQHKETFNMLAMRPQALPRTSALGQAA